MHVSYFSRTSLLDAHPWADCHNVVAGLDEHSIALARTFDEVLYVSCNPAKLAQDLEQLPNHKIAAAALFDQFPWTQHAEVAVKLVRR